jgi:methyl-accepting chemotaxis protein
MLKFNRIGNKLGLVGLFGIALSGGMVVNQIISEKVVITANKFASDQQQITDHALEANIALRRMQLAVRDIRLAQTPADVEKNLKLLGEADARSSKKIDAAIERATKPDNRERFQTIKSLAGEYFTKGSELAKTQLKIFELVAKRNNLAANWSQTFDAMLAMPAVSGATNRLEIEKALYEADAMFNELRAATWRLMATGDESQKPLIQRRLIGLSDTLNRLIAVANDKTLDASLGKLGAVKKEFSSLTNDVVQAEAVKKELVEIKTIPVADRAVELMRTAVDVGEKLTEEAIVRANTQLSDANQLSFIAAILVMISLIGSVIFTFMGIARPLTRLNDALAKMAGGELNIEIPGADRGDEVGDIAKTVVIIRENAEQKAREEADAKKQQDEIARQQRKADMIKLANQFEAAVSEIVDTVSSASTELEASASTLTATAHRSQEVTIAVAAASEEASTNVQSVASATEELSSSVNEISRQVQASSRMASEAVGQARHTNEKVGELSKAAARIGDVVELINTIAGQTNLLALNATIEAARAGEAGRGFAVVAAEVKALAEQTAKATGEIGQQVSGIQLATQDSVKSIQEISGTIERLSEVSSAIAAAVEEQGAATQEISRNVQQAAQGTQQVSSNITDVQRGASETGTASSQVLSAAQSLSADSNRLKLEVGNFLSSVRAA